MSKTTTALAVLALTGGGLLASSSTAGAACAPGYVASKNTCIKIPLPTGTDASRSATTDVATFLEAVGGHRLLARSRVVRLGATAPGVYTVEVSNDEETPAIVISGTRTVTGTTRKAATLRLKLTKQGKAWVRQQAEQGQRQVSLGLAVTYQAPTPTTPGATAVAPVLTNVDVDFDLY